MKKLLFTFIDLTSKDVAVYDSLGFEIEVDDAANGVLYAELDLSDFDLMNVLSVMEDCKSEGLFPQLELNDKLFDFEEGYEHIDQIASEDPLKK